MAKQNVAVLDIGTSRISAIIADRGVNNTFDIHGFAEVNYSGFMDGEFLSPEELTDTIRGVLTSVSRSANCRINYLTIGVPAEFSVNAVRSIERAYPKRHKITDRDIDELFHEADEFGASTTHRVINRSPIYFCMDDNRRLIEPKGIVTTKITAMLSFVLADREFINLMNEIIKPLGIANVNYVSEPLSEALYLLEPTERDSCAILVDTGYLSTSVSIVMGDGLVALRSFSLGDGHIVADLAEAFDLPFDVAESLKNKIVLSYQPEKGDYYEVDIDGELYKIDAIETNEIVGNRIAQIAKMVKKCLDDSKFQYPAYIPIQLTGGGICYLKGARDMMQKLLQQDVRIISPPVPQMDKPHASSILGLLDMALKQCKLKTTFILFRLFSK
ncbi:MAG: rod shape-determining protein [Clostridia bacterium]|nr:rod shape-determining protein [Clostridia bacterium]